MACTFFFPDLNKWVIDIDLSVTLYLYTRKKEGNELII